MARKLNKALQAKLELLAVDCITFDLSEKEAMRYIAVRAPELAGIDPATLRRYKAKVKSDPYYDEWLSQFVKMGYVRMYKDRIDEMLTLNARLKRMLLEEESFPRTKEDRQAWIKAHPNTTPPPIQNRGMIIALSSQIIACNKRLSQLQNSGPVAAKLHAILKALNPDTPEDERKRVLEQMLGDPSTPEDDDDDDLTLGF
ncbi:MAG: hypothetical protein ABI348_11040 [Nitrososphaera sp.]